MEPFWHKRIEQFAFYMHLTWFSLIFVATIGAKETGIPSGEDRDTCLHAADTMAIRACDRLLQREPDNLQILLLQSQHLAIKKEYDAAIKIMEQAEQYHPDSTKVKHSLKKLISYQKEQKWQENRNEPTKKAMGEGERSTGYKLNRIRCLRLTGKPALEACNQALKEKKDDYVLYKARGTILEQLGRDKEAAQDFLRWVKYNPAQPQQSPQKSTNKKKKQEIVVIKKKDQKDKIKVESISTPAATETVTTASVIPTPSKEKTEVQAEITAPSLPLERQQSTDGESGSQPNDVVSKLSTLKMLHENSLINKSEYDKRRAIILDSVVAVSQNKRHAIKSSIDPAILGKYHALVIGEQNYRSLPKLKTATRDAESVSQVLQELYGFKVTTLMDASRRDILLALSEYRMSLTKNDNLLIYYAGHGWLDEKADAGYWLPIEAVEENKVDWISMATLTSSVRVLEAKHVMIVADSCFSGKLARGAFIQEKNPDYLSRIAKKRTRVVLTSGGLEPVLDGGGQGGHSVFAATFLQVLEENKEIMDGSTLFTKIRRPVMLKAQQVPEYSDIRMAGHEGGDFVFLPIDGGQE